MQRDRRRLVVVAVWCLAAVLWAPGAGARESSDQEVTKRIEELKARVAELESERADDSIEPVVVAKNKNLKLILGGRVHRMIMVVDDTLATDAFFTDSEQGPTALKLQAEAIPNDKLTIAATLDVAIQQNRPFKVSQKDPNPGIDLGNDGPLRWSRS